MELKTEAGNITLTCSEDVQELFQAAAELIKRATAISGNVTPDTKVPLIYGSDADIRPGPDKGLQISVLTPLGWAQIRVPEAKKESVIQLFIQATQPNPSGPVH